MSSRNSAPFVSPARDNAHTMRRAESWSMGAEIGRKLERVEQQLRLRGRQLSPPRVSLGNDGPQVVVVEVKCLRRLPVAAKYNPVAGLARRAPDRLPAILMCVDDRRHLLDPLGLVEDGTNLLPALFCP